MKVTSKAAHMGDAPHHTDKLTALVELLRETARLQIRASVRPLDAKPGSDEARLMVHFTGPDTPLLTAENGRLLDAIETLAAEMLGLSATEKKSFQFDADGFRAERQMSLRRVAETAIERVRFTGKPFVFPPMRGRDRKLLIHILVTAGLHYETMGDQAARWVVLFPRNVQSFLDCTAIRQSGN